MQTESYNDDDYDDDYDNDYDDYDDAEDNNNYNYNYNNNNNNSNSVTCTQDIQECAKAQSGTVNDLDHRPVNKVFLVDYF